MGEAQDTDNEVCINSSNPNNESNILSDTTSEFNLGSQLRTAAESSELYIEAPSSDLTDSLGPETETVLEQHLERAKEILSEFEKAKLQYDDKIADMTNMAVFPSVEEREEYTKAIADRLYTEIHKQARSFLRTWCRVNNYIQKWGTPFQKNQGKLTSDSEFVPQVYTLRVRKNDSFEEEFITLADMMPTAREACIHAAKKLGFDQSNERKLGFSKFSPVALNKILSDPKYLEEQRMIHTFEEHRKQIDDRRYVPLSLRSKWQKELEDALVKNSGVI